MFSWIGQTLAVTALNIRTIPQRLGSSAVAIVGIASVVVVFVSVLSIAAGFTAAMSRSGSLARAIVMRSGADSEMTSGLGRPEVDVIKQAPREIATLRALGFNSTSVVVSVLAEALALGTIGGAIGAVAAYVAFNGYQTSTMNFQTFSQVAFAFRVTPQLLVMGLIYSLLMGLVGGLFPAIRAARLPIFPPLCESSERAECLAILIG